MADRKRDEQQPVAATSEKAEPAKEPSPRAAKSAPAKSTPAKAAFPKGAKSAPAKAASPKGAKSTPAKAASPKAASPKGAKAAPSTRTSAATKPAKTTSPKAAARATSAKAAPAKAAKADPDDVLLARLRAADPAADLPPWQPERIRRLLEDARKQPRDPVEPPESAPSPAPSGPARTRWSRALPWLAGAAAAAMVAIAGFSLMAQRVETPSEPSSVAAPEPSSTTVAAPAAVPGRCLPPGAEVLAGAELAVDATVTEVAGDQVTLTVHQWFAGSPTDELVVTAVPASLQELIGAPDLQQGQRYLLAANGGQLMVCGFSGPFDSERSTLYSTAFGG